MYNGFFSFQHLGFLRETNKYDIVLNKSGNY